MVPELYNRFEDTIEPLILLMVSMNLLRCESKYETVLRLQLLSESAVGRSRSPTTRLSASIPFREPTNCLLEGIDGVVYFI